MNTIKIESPDSRIDGWYVFTTDIHPDDWRWNDRGNGPEIITPNVDGPYPTETQALASIAADDENRGDE